MDLSIEFKYQAMGFGGEQVYKRMDHNSDGFFTFTLWRFPVEFYYDKAPG